MAASVKIFFYILTFPLMVFLLHTDISIPVRQARPFQKPEINIWYGHQQHFGFPGRAQRWINILGNITNPEMVTEASYQLNSGPVQPLTLGSDLHRLARPGDFNVEIGYDDLQPSNQLKLTFTTNSRQTITEKMNIHLAEKSLWPLPYQVDFSEVKDLQDVVQVVDGHWELTDQGVHTVAPYYDRVLSLGDTSWHDYESLINLTIHDFITPEPGPPTYNVTHFGVAMRWQGHTKDGRQPSRQWYPLGAQGEFLLKPELDSCRWRILYDGNFKSKPATYSKSLNPIALNEKIKIRTQVKTLENNHTRYRFKQWKATDPEPAHWDLEGIEDGKSDLSSGALCLVPHNSEVTIHTVEVKLI